MAGADKVSILSCGIKPFILCCNIDIYMGYPIIMYLILFLIK